MLGIALAARALERRLDELTLAQLRILSLVDADPVRAGTLAERAAMSRPTLSGLIDGLVNRGWVERHLVDGDRRGVTLRITPAGSVALARALDEAGRALQALLDLVPADRQATVVEALGTLKQAAHDRFAPAADPAPPPPADLRRRSRKPAAPAAPATPAGPVGGLA